MYTHVNKCVHDQKPSKSRQETAGEDWSVFCILSLLSGRVGDPTWCRSLLTRIPLCSKLCWFACFLRRYQLHGIKAVLTAPLHIHTSLPSDAPIGTTWLSEKWQATTKWRDWTGCVHACPSQKFWVQRANLILSFYNPKHIYKTNKPEKTKAWVNHGKLG